MILHTGVYTEYYQVYKKIPILMQEGWFRFWLVLTAVTYCECFWILFSGWIHYSQSPRRIRKVKIKALKKECHPALSAAKPQRGMGKKWWQFHRYGSFEMCYYCLFMCTCKLYPELSASLTLECYSFSFPWSPAAGEMVSVTEGQRVSPKTLPRVILYKS